jgi:hypothetical protein
MESSKEMANSDVAMKMYEQCWDTFPRDQLLYQEDLLNLNLIPAKDLDLLLKYTQYLVDQKLFNPHYDGHKRLGWKIVPIEVAEK